ncbi:hypothetical protein A1332_23125 [Methylomonas methanica]|uniref:Uncharacterized protein n=1 Tax=Methylomonas methanica TaxID=421 RepID=A0A177LRY2_METMH|nr:hypothetical protein A1332_23125 [Methylomonas methanica]
MFDWDRAGDKVNTMAAAGTERRWSGDDYCASGCDLNGVAVGLGKYLGPIGTWFRFDKPMN